MSRLQEEISWRLAEWRSLRGRSNISPQELRDRRIYGSARGIWRDVSRTSLLGHPSGLTVSVLHTGRHYDDDLFHDGIIYHYPATARPTTDEGEIESLRNCAAASLPIFVITSGDTAKTRTVQLGYIVEFQEDQCLIVFDGMDGAETPPSSASLLDTLKTKAKPSLGLVTRPKKKASSQSFSGSGGYSRQSKTTGDAGELIVFEYLKKHEAGISELRWVAQAKETPGWDIEYKDKSGTLICVEVKSSQSKSISGVELTSNEWRAAEEQRGNYRLALVAQCLSLNPIIQFIEDPFGEAAKGLIDLRSTRFELTWP